MAPSVRHIPESPVLAWTFRVFVALNVATCLGFIIYALIRANPPKTALPL